jgi:hypothetical protein
MNLKALSKVSTFMFLFPVFAHATILTFKGTVPPGSSISTTVEFDASNHLWPLCGTPGLGDGFEANNEFQDITAVIQPDGTYVITADLNTSQKLPGDPLNICKPKFENISVYITAPGNAGDMIGFVVYPFQLGTGTLGGTDISGVSEISTDNEDDNFYIPNFSDSENYQYTIQLAP